MTKYSIIATATASILAVLLPLVTAVPTNRVINARQAGVPVDCNFSAPVVAGDTNFFSIIVPDGGSGPNLLYWNLFGVPAGNVGHDELGLFSQTEADERSKFDFLASDDTNTAFIIQQRSHSQKILVAGDDSTDGSGFTGADSGTTIIPQCIECPQGQSTGTVFASNCLFETLLTDGVPSSQCATNVGGDKTRVELQDCGTGSQYFTVLFEGTDPT